MSAAASLSNDDVYKIFTALADSYELIGDKPIGEKSGFGAVWRAKDNWLSCDVAIKISDCDLRDEIRICREIDGETVRIFDYYCTTDGWHAYTMELLQKPWTTLSSYIDHHKYKPNDIQHYFDVFELIRAALHGLNTLHGKPYQRQGCFVHADIKPANLFVLIKPKKQVFSVFRMPAHSEMIKIIDLGVSVKKGDPVIGYTRAYRPEGVTEGGPGFDLYALAVSLVELLTGKRPTHKQMADKRLIKKALAKYPSGSVYLDCFALDFVTKSKHAFTQKSVTARSLLQFLDDQLFNVEPLSLLCLRHLTKFVSNPLSKADMANVLYPVLAKYWGWKNHTAKRLDFTKDYIAQLYTDGFLLKMDQQNRYFVR